MAARQCWVLTATAATVLAGVAIVAPAADAAKPKAPAAVSRAHAGAASSTAVLVSWSNPKSKRFKSTVVRVVAGTKAPRSAKSGRGVTTVAKGKHAVSVSRLAPGAVYTVGLFASDGKKHYAKGVAVRIQTAPSAIRALKATSTSSAISLTYRFSTSRTANAVVVRYARGATPPAYPTSGTGVSAGRTGVTVPGLLEKNRYTFSVWARDAGNRYSPVAHISAGTKAGPTGNSGALSGTVFGGTTKTRLRDADVYAFSDNDDEDGYGASTSADGTYRIVGLPVGRYNLCFGSDAKSASAKAGYSSGCLATAVQIVAGQTTGGHDYTLAYATGFTGKVTGLSSADLLAGVDVYGYDEDGDFGGDVGIGYGDDFGSTTDASGVYTVTGLPAGTHLVLCFAAQDADGQSVTGYLDDCVDGLTGQAGKIGTQNKALGAASAISGKVSGNTSNGDASLAGVAVVAIEADVDEEDADFRDVRYSFTGADGTYVVPGLIPDTNYFVCYDASGVDAVDTQIRDGFVTACETASGLTPWSGDSEDLPAGLASVTVSATAAPMPHPAVVLAPGAAITGQVYGANKQAVRAEVYVLDGDDNFVGGDRVGNGDTTFRATGLPAGNYRVCVYSEDSRYASECYDDVTWNADEEGEDGEDPALPTGLTAVPVSAGQPSTLPNDIVLARH